MSTTALQLVEKRQPDQELQRQVGALQLRTLEDFQTLGQIFVKSKFFSDVTDAAQGIVKVMAGAELGFPAIASMTGVYIVKGKVSLSANLIAAAIKRSGKYNYKVRKLDVAICEIEFFEGGESIGVSSFTMTEAQAGKLHMDWDRDKKEWKDKATWKNFPRNMLFARAMSNGAKWFCPDIFGGPIYTPDELGATIDGETGEVIEISAEAAPSAISAPPPAQPVISAPVKPSSVQTPAPAEPVPAIELVSLGTLHAIENLWPQVGATLKGEKVSLRTWLSATKQISEPTEMPQELGVKVLGWLQDKALKLSEPEKPKADRGAGLDQWLCTKETRSRQLALDVLEITRRLEVTGVTEEEWREELNAIFHDYPQPVSRKSLTAEEIRETWLPLIEGWAKRNEAKAKGGAA